MRLCLDVIMCCYEGVNGFLNLYLLMGNDGILLRVGDFEDLLF